MKERVGQRRPERQAMDRRGDRSFVEPLLEIPLTNLV
jgi:hypothetical protein